MSPHLGSVVLDFRPLQICCEGDEEVRLAHVSNYSHGVLEAIAVELERAVDCRRESPFPSLVLTDVVLCHQVLLLTSFELFETYQSDAWLCSHPTLLHT